jgi:hypothetical protein
MLSTENIAHIYVNYVEPGAKIFVLFMAVMAVLYFWNFVKDPKKQLDMASQFFHWMIGMMTAIVMGIGVAIYETCRFLWRVLHVIFATLRDFFISRI